MACPTPLSNTSLASALAAALNPSSPPDPALLNMLGPNAASNYTLLQSLACGGLLSQNCTALCPNQDLAGIGVRIAFYFQSLVTALLVIFSPANSVPTAWAGTLLTATLVIAAMVSKGNGNLTLHHATLVLNFATLSCISTLAVAPILPIWRLTPSEYYEQEIESHSHLTEDEKGPNSSQTQQTNKKPIINEEQIKRAQRRSRLVFSLAILIQVVLQWAWGIYLFVSWSYSQPECNGDTILLIFMVPIKTRTIDSVDRNGHRFFIWPVWLLFCLSITFALTIILTLSNSYRSLPVLSFSTDGTNSKSSTLSEHIAAWIQIFCDWIPPRERRRDVFSFFCDVLSLILWCMFVAASEIQMRDNCVFYGENSFGGLGQITAAGVSIVPLWSLCTALYRYPALREKQKLQPGSTAGQPTQNVANSHTTGSETAELSPGHNTTDVASHSVHGLQPSDASAISTGFHETQPLLARMSTRRSASE